MKIEATKTEEATRLYGRHFDHQVCHSGSAETRAFLYQVAPQACASHVDA